MPGFTQRLRLALVLWNGNVGGAEILNVKLAERLRHLGVDTTMLFIETPQPLAKRLSLTDIPYRSLDFGRGRDVLKHPRRYAVEASRAGPDGALLIERGFMAAALRMGGYRGPIIAVEHGPLLFEQLNLTRIQRLIRQISRVTGAWAASAEVAVSDFMLDKMHQHAHARTIMRIYNGVDPDTYLSPPRSNNDHQSDLVVGFAGRLVFGKGVDHLIRAIGKISKRFPVKLLIAGDGPERMHLMSLARELRITSSIEFLGIIDDMVTFWQQCDIVVTPSDTFESFSMTTLEAMSCGKPVVATSSGALPELIIDGMTGTLVPTGDVDSLTTALVLYAEHPEMRWEHGLAARARAIKEFHIQGCAKAYLDLFNALAPEQACVS